jgi:hypothetical protein
MPSRIGRLYAIAAWAAALVAIAGCGGSSAPKRSKHAVFVPPGLTTAAAQPSPAASSGSSTGASTGTTTRGGATTVTPAAATSSSTGSRHPPVSKITFAPPGGDTSPAFLSSADAICRSFRARARAIGAGATTLVSQEAELDNLLSATERSLKALTQLSPPASDEPGLRRFVTMTAAAVVAFADAQSRTRSTSEAVGAQVEGQDLADSARSSRDVTAAAAAARQLGLHVCGSPGAAWL